MYYIIKSIENVIKFFRNKIKIIYWKMKYGKRIKIGKNFKFRKGMLINISKDGYLEIGNDNFFNNYCSVNCHESIIIGDNNLFGESVKIYDHNHVFNNKNIDMRHTFKKGKIKIGDNNWIGSNVVILDKTELGNRNVISANILLNQKYKNENLVRISSEVKIEKIIYKGEKNDKSSSSNRKFK